MSTNTDYLKMATQDYRISVDITEPRKFRLSDVWYDGSDTGHDFPPEADDFDAFDRSTYFDDITRIGPISGSVRSGLWQAPLTVPLVGDFSDFFGVDLRIQTWHGGNPGVVGAAGVDKGRVRIFRGYMRTRSTREGDESEEGNYDIKSSTDFLMGSSFSRSLDWYPESPYHPGPISNAAVIDHLIKQHTNFTPRSGYSVYLPDQEFDRYSVNEGSVYSMLKAVADTSGLDGWVFSSRSDDLVITGHPNIVGLDIYSNGASDINNPIMELDDDMVLSWDIPEMTGQEVASVMLTGMKSDQSEIVAVSNNVTGIGSRERWPSIVRCDDQNFLNDRSGFLLKHMNRQFPNVVARCPLNVAIDAGDVILVTHRSRRLDTKWYRKPFVVTDVSYDIDLEAETFFSTFTLDEIVV